MHSEVCKLHQRQERTDFRRIGLGLGAVARKGHGASLTCVKRSPYFLLDAFAWECAAGLFQHGPVALGSKAFLLSGVVCSQAAHVAKHTVCFGRIGVKATQVHGHDGDRARAL